MGSGAEYRRRLPVEMRPRSYVTYMNVPHACISNSVAFNLNSDSPYQGAAYGLTRCKIKTRMQDSMLSVSSALEQRTNS